MLLRCLKIVGVIFALLIVCLIGLVGAGAITSQVSSVSTLSTGRTVTATVSGWSESGAADTKDTVRLNMAGHTIVVAPSQVTIDGAPIAKINQGVKAVDVTCDGRQIVFVADGAVATY